LCIYDDEYTIPESGYYLFTASITFIVNVYGSVLLSVRVHDSMAIWDGFFERSNTYVTVSLTDIVYFHAGHHLEVEVWVEYPPVDIAGNELSFFSITKLGDW